MTQIAFPSALLGLAALTAGVASAGQGCTPCSVMEINDSSRPGFRDQDKNLS